MRDDRIGVAKPLVAAIVGSGNIGSDLLMKSLRSPALDVRVMVGIDPDSAGLARAREQGVATTARGVGDFLESGLGDEVELVFDATSAKAHVTHADSLIAAGKQIVDLTPAALGPYVVPTVNLGEHVGAPNVNMVTCGGQATIPMVYAVGRAGGEVVYGEIVASISSRSAGPGTRANIDEFTETTSRGIEVVGGAQRGKAIIVLNPAEPPLLMRNTVFCLTTNNDEASIKASVEDMVAEVTSYVPGYRLTQPPQTRPSGPIRLPDGEGGTRVVEGTRVALWIEVEGGGDWLPRYAGNLDIMTSAALAVGERIAGARGGR